MVYRSTLGNGMVAVKVLVFWPTLNDGQCSPWYYLRFVEFGYLLLALEHSVVGESPNLAYLHTLVVLSEFAVGIVKSCYP